MRPKFGHHERFKGASALVSRCVCRHAVPKSLKEYKLVCTGADKPLHAVALLRQLAAEPTIIFTASVEATRR